MKHWLYQAAFFRFLLVFRNFQGVLVSHVVCHLLRQIGVIQGDLIISIYTVSLEGVTKSIALTCHHVQRQAFADIFCLARGPLLDIS